MKRILITGSTDGIGRLAAEKLALQGHELLIHGRNPEKLNEIVSSIKSQSQNNDIKGYVADFSNLNEVARMANEITHDFSSLDVLINNAGVFKTNIPHDSEQIDIRLVVNVLAPYLLTKKLMPIIREAQNSRIINLSSAAQAPVSIEDFNSQMTFSAQEAYAKSKLALTMWSFYLAKENNPPSVIAVNPGSLLNTKMAIEAYGQHWSSASKGSNLLVDLAVSSVFEGQTGKYFDNDKGDDRGDFGEAHLDAYDQEKVKNLILGMDELLS